VDIASDLLFNHGAWKMGEARTALGDTVYNFVFTYYRKGSIGPMAALLPFEAATHCMELPYFFGQSIVSDFQPGAEDAEIVDRFTTYLTNFVKTGNPNSEKFPEKWEPVRPDALDHYFLFGQTEFGMRDNICEGRPKVWDRLLSENSIDFAKVNAILDGTERMKLLLTDQTDFFPKSKD